MEELLKILAIDPGSTSTKVGIFHDGRLTKENIKHSREELERYTSILQQKEMRFEAIKQFIERLRLNSFNAIVGRGGLIKPVEGGVYRVNRRMIEDLQKGIYGQHASNLGGILAYEFASLYNCPAFIADPVVIDEMDRVAKFSGLKGIERLSIFHALNQRATARKACEKLSLNYNKASIIVAHMGGGISVGLHKNGRVVDVNNALDGDGPFAMERSGSLPVSGVLKLIRDKKFTPESLLDTVSKRGGVYSYLSTVDMSEIEKRIADGDRYAEDVIEALIYQISKEIAALSSAVCGKVDAIVLTGGLAHSRRITEGIKKRISFISRVLIFEGEFEIEALIDAAKRVLNKEEEPKNYS